MNPDTILPLDADTAKQRFRFPNFPEGVQQSITDVAVKHLYDELCKMAAFLRLMQCSKTDLIKVVYKAFGLFSKNFGIKL